MVNCSMVSKLEEQKGVKCAKISQKYASYLKTQ